MGVRQTPEWKEVVRRVHQRDRVCRFLSVITPEEYATLKRHARTWELLMFDVAHVFPVGKYPHLVADEDNLVLLNRFSHRCLDSSRSPLTGEPISPEEVRSWWERVVGPVVWQRLVAKASPLH